MLNRVSSALDEDLSGLGYGLQDTRKENFVRNGYKRLTQRISVNQESIDGNEPWLSGISKLLILNHKYLGLHSYHLHMSHFTLSRANFLSW